MFWDKFDLLCSSAGKAPNTVAKELGIPSGSVTAWKNGATPRNATIVKISEYFGVSVDFLTKEKQPATQMDDELLDNALIDKLVGLTPEELSKVDAFVQGLLASR